MPLSDAETASLFGLRTPLKIIVNPSLVVVNAFRFERVTDQAETLH